MKKEQKFVSIALSQEVLKKIEDGNYNRSKLIDTLLTEHFKKENENNSEKKVTILVLFTFSRYLLVYNY